MFTYLEIPEDYKIRITLPVVSSYLDNRGQTSDDFGKSYYTNPDAMDENGDVAPGVTETVSTVYDAKILNLTLNGSFDFSISANFSSGNRLQQALSPLNTFLSEMGNGIISQRSSVLTYSGSTIKDITLPFLLINYNSGDDFLKGTLDHLYRAVLPTLGDKGDYAIKSGNGPLQVVDKILKSQLSDSKGVVEGLKKAAKEGGAVIAPLAEAVTSVNDFFGGVNESFFGFYAQQAPLSYDPTDLSNIKGRVLLEVGKYFKCNDLVISNLSVRMSQAVNSSGAPLYAEGDVTFRFVKTISHTEFRDYFVGRSNKGVLAWGATLGIGQNSKSGTIYTPLYRAD